MEDVGQRREKGVRTVRIMGILRIMGARSGLTWRFVALAAVILAGVNAGWGQTTSSKHKITLTFHYDFRATPACSEKVQKNCVVQFNVYDLSAGYKHRTKLYSIPVGAVNESGVKEITGTSPLILFETGKHLIGMAAQTPENLESDPRVCTTWVEVPPPPEATTQPQPEASPQPSTK